MKETLKKRKYLLGHLAISLTLSFFLWLLSGMSFWICFLIGEFSVLLNGSLADWEDRDESAKARDRQRQWRLAKRLTVFLATIGSIVGGLYACDVGQDRKYSVEVLEDTKLFEDWELLYYSANPVEVRAGESLRVVRIRYSKEFQMVKVEKENGETGWLISGGSVELSK